MRPQLAIAAILLFTGGPDPAGAQVPPGMTETGSCSCFCVVRGQSEGTMSTYPPIAGSCGVYNGHTCNIEDPATGGMRSGQLAACGFEILDTASAAPLSGMSDGGGGSIGTMPLRPLPLGPLPLGPLQRR